jgi:hypothetical protein
MTVVPPVISYLTCTSHFHARMDFNAFPEPVDNMSLVGDLQLDPLEILVQELIENCEVLDP